MVFRFTTLALFLLPVQAFSQTNAEDIEEIKVTAQMREQSAFDVPSSISVFDQKSLTNLQIDELTELATLTPGVTAQAQNIINPTIVIRGISSDEGAAQESPRVAISLNGADVSRNRGSLFHLYDMGHVEIVRGANTTLLGNSSAVGSILANTHSPEPENKGRVTLSAGSHGSFMTQGFGNIAFNEDLRVRLAFFSNQHDGYVNDESASENLMAIDQQSLRPSVSWDINDRLQMNLVATFESANDSGVAYKSGTTRPTNGDLSYFSSVEFGGDSIADSIYRDGEVGIDRNTKDYNLQFAWQLNDQILLSSISHYREFDSYEAADADGSAAWTLHVAEHAKGDKWSEELRLNYDEDHFSLVAGLIYSDEDGSQNLLTSTDEGTFFLCAPQIRRLALPLIDPNGTFNLASIPCQNTDGTTNSLTPFLTEQAIGFALQSLPYSVDITNHGERQSWSFYIDGSYSLNERLTVYVGARYVTEDRESGFESVVPNSAVLGVPLIPLNDTEGQVISANGSGSALLPRLSLNWELSDYHSLYFSWAKGRKPGVTAVFTGLDRNFQPLNPVRQIEEERLTNSEVGFKGRTENGYWNYAVSIFDQGYENFQIDRLNDAGLLEVINTGEASNRGVEFELSWKITDELSLRGSAAYIDAEIDEGDFEGQKFRMQPERTVAAAAIYEQDINKQFIGYANISYSYQSEVFFDDALQPVEPFSGLALTQDAYGVGNLSLGIKNKDRNWSMGIWITNFLDEEYLVDAGNGGASFGIPTFVPAAPRMSGVSFALDF